MEYGHFLIIIILILILNKSSLKEYLTTKKEISDLDKRYYKVSSNLSDSRKAANKLSELHAFIINLMTVLKKKFVLGNEGSLSERMFVTRLLKRYNPDTFSENNPDNSGETSFVVNKGEQFSVCLREKNNGKIGAFHQNNTLQFVIMHELSHIGCNSFGHNEEFWTAFRFLIKEATSNGLYTPVNYSVNPTKYCGMTINHNPIF